MKITNLLKLNESFDGDEDEDESRMHFEKHEQFLNQIKISPGNRNHETYIQKIDLMIEEIKHRTGFKHDNSVFWFVLNPIQRHWCRIIDWWIHV